MTISKPGHRRIGQGLKDSHLNLLRTMKAHHSIQLRMDPVFICGAIVEAKCTPEAHEDNGEVPRLM